MPELKILNNKEIKEILKLIEGQWGAKTKFDCGLVKNPKNRVFAISKDISGVETSKLRINSVGMYFCETDEKGIRLSIEGAQIIGPKAKKNVVELDYEQARRWFKGEDLEKECIGCSGFVILKSQNPFSENFDYLGCGRCASGKILNYVGKTRRIQISANKA